MKDKFGTFAYKNIHIKLKKTNYDTTRVFQE